MNKAPDMEQAIDILKRSSLEVELSAKEKEVKCCVKIFPFVSLMRIQANISYSSRWGF